jgi:ketosteroid isomerase-like protein
MRKPSLAGLLTSLLICIPLIYASSTAIAADSEEMKLQALVPRIVAAWESFDLTKVEPYYAQDEGFAYFDLTPLKYGSWAEYRAGARKAIFDTMKSLKLKVNDDLRVHRRGSLAWATFTFGAEIVNMQGASSHLDGRWTMVFEKRARGWTVVHEHVSVPLSGS